ncbi:MAG: ATP-binding protein [Anaerolineae bacterium]|jgi:signal transduction histidine kinase
MLISLLGSTAAFVIGTALTRDRLLKQEIGADAERVAELAHARVENVAIAAALLASDPRVVIAVQADDEESLMALHSRALVVRDRFDLHLVQVYDHYHEQARTNLVLSNLYRESSLLDVVEPGETMVRVDGEQVLLLSRAPMLDDAGDIIVGIDLGAELQRLVSQYRLSSELGLSVGCATSLGDEDCVRVGTQEALPFDASDGRTNGHYVQRLPLTLGESAVDLVLVRSTSDIAQVTNTGLNVVIVSAVVTTLLLAALGVVITRSILQPIKQLSAAAEAVAGGDLDQQVDTTRLASPLGFGNEDEIGLLATTFNGMVTELNGLYQDLEARVQARTKDLAMAAEVARAVSSSLDLDVALDTSVRLIQEQLGMYYVAIFIVEPDSEVAVLRAAMGEAGQELRARGFQIALGARSLVGAAVSTRQPCVAQDVRDEPRYLETPYLPDTRSEATIPLLVGKTVIGVLDVQCRRAHVFSEDMVNLLVTLGDQIAIGVRNAQLYTRQRQTAVRLAAANTRLRELDQTKNQFIHNVSHELRTPLGLILNYAEALESEVLGPLEGEQRHAMAGISRRAQSMTKLVDDITALLEAEGQATARSLISFSQLAQEALEDFEPLARRNHLTLRGKIAAEPCSVLGHRHHLRKVVDNLIGNAIKFTPEGGVIVVELSRQDGRIEFQVTDTGIGIPADKQAYVFERFYQADSTIRQRYGGSGLGLALVKEIVEGQGGQVTLESEVGQGSTFTVLIPTADSKENQR